MSLDNSHFHCATKNKFILNKIYINMICVKYIWRKLQDTTERQKQKLKWIGKHYWMKRLNTRQSLIFFQINL